MDRNRSNTMLLQTEEENLEMSLQILENILFFIPVLLTMNHRYILYYRQALLFI